MSLLTPIILLRYYPCHLQEWCCPFVLISTTGQRGIETNRALAGLRKKTLQVLNDLPVIYKESVLSKFFR